MKKLLFKSVLFSVLMAIILLYIDPLFIDNSEWDVSGFNAFYETEENTADIVFIGNSHLNKGIDSYIIDAKCKTNSLKISGGALNMAQVYYNLKEVLSKQTPSLIAIEAYCLVDPHGYNNTILKEDKLRVRPFNSEYYKRFGSVKNEEISAIYPENKLFHKFNFFRFHDIWTTPEKFSNSIHAKYSLNPKRIHQDFNKDFRNMKDAKINQFRSRDFEDKEIRISKDESMYLDKIIKLSEKHKFELLFFTVPVLNVYYKKTKTGFNRVTSDLNALVKDKKNIKVFDINQKTQGLDQTCVLPDPVNTNQHLNYKGIVKTSNIIAKYINDNYSFKSNNLNQERSIESVLYTNKKIEKDSSFLGYISQVNTKKYRNGDSIKKVITIPKSQSQVTLKGWMFKKGLNSKKSIRRIALKKNNSFIFISSGNIETKENKALEKRYGKVYKNSGFEYKINKNILEKGKYKLFYIIESNSGEIFYKDMWKWITIE